MTERTCRLVRFGWTPRPGGEAVKRYGPLLLAVSRPPVLSASQCLPPGAGLPLEVAYLV